jgi:lysophospholipase L1-like esterase
MGMNIGWRASIAALVICAMGIGAMAAQTKQETPKLKIAALPENGKILFLGDSITYSGGYVDAIDATLFLYTPDKTYTLINLGLPSETVSGLTEPNHAGGAFPRPDLHERLDRVLAAVKPDVVVACYGMNDGIYYPYSDARSAKFQEGILKLREKVIASGAKIWHLTPPPFDRVPLKAQTLPDGLTEYPSGKSFAGYDSVLARYSKWLLSQRRNGWNVIDIHTPLNKFLLEQRKTKPDYVFANDGVHLNSIGQRLIAREILRVWKVPAKLLPNAENIEGDETKIATRVHERQRLLTDSYLTQIGHKRPGMAKGVSIADADKQAAEKESEIRSILRR